MKRFRRLKKVLLVIILSLGVISAGTYFTAQKLLPAWIESKIEAALLENGVQAKAQVTELSLRGLTLRMWVESPLKATLPALRIERLEDFRFYISFHEADSALLIKKGRDQLEILPKSLDIRAGIDLKNRLLQLERAQLEISLNEPLQSTLKLNLDGNLSEPSGAIEIKLPPQRIGVAEVRSPLEFCWKVRSNTQLSKASATPCSRESAFHVQFPKIPVFLVRFRNQPIHYASEKSSLSGEIRFSNEGSHGRFVYDLKKTGKNVHLTGDSEAHLGVTSLRRTLKKLNIHNTDLKNTDLRLKFDVRVPTVKNAAVSMKSSFEAEIPEGSIRALDLRGFLLRTEIICNGTLKEIQSPLQACKFDSVNPSLLVEAERIGKQQPLRDLRLVLDDKAAGKFSASWQGAKLNSSIQDLSVKSLASTSGNLKIEAKNLSLFEMLKLLDRPDLSGKGTLEGFAKIRWNTENGLSSGLWIEPAELKAIAPGVLNYGTTRNAKPVDTLKEFQSLLSQGQQALVLRALEDFHYRELKAGLTRTPKDFLRVELKLSGRNPTLAKGQPFEFNMPVEGNLEGLIINSMMRDFSNIPRDE